MGGGSSDGKGKTARGRPPMPPGTTRAEVKSRVAEIKSREKSRRRDPYMDSSEFTSDYHSSDDSRNAGKKARSVIDGMGLLRCQSDDSYTGAGS